MRKVFISILAACIGVAGPSSLAQAGLFSATGAVIAILADDLFVGEAQGHLNGAGTLAIHSQENPRLTCHGKFTSSALLGGTGQMSCSDGSTGTFKFKRLSVFTGHGVGNFTLGTMSFVYGLTAAEAAAYLTLPKGKKLARSGAELKLVDL